MSGRIPQLGRQLRKLRHIVGGAPDAVPTTTLRRATQLARDLACEHAAIKEPPAAFRALVERGVLEPALAERLIGYVVAAAERDDAVGAEVMTVGGDLDRFLRSLEAEAPAPPFAPIVARERATPDSTAAVVVSGRVLELDVRGGRATIAIDGDVVGTFALAAAPSGGPEVQREPSGATRVVWTEEDVVIELAPDFRTATASTGSTSPRAGTR